jgi:hyperosmotically inducible protein
MKNSKFIVSLIFVGSLFYPTIVFADDKDSGSRVGEFVKDSTITAQVKVKLLAAQDIDSLHIAVDTDNNGVVALTGAVKSATQKEEVQVITSSVDGVRQVLNNLKIDPDQFSSKSIPPAEARGYL